MHKAFPVNLKSQQWLFVHFPPILLAQLILDLSSGVELEKLLRISLGAVTFLGLISDYLVWSLLNRTCRHQQCYLHLTWMGSFAPKPAASTSFPLRGSACCCCFSEIQSFIPNLKLYPKSSLKHSLALPCRVKACLSVRPTCHYLANGVTKSNLHGGWPGNLIGKSLTPAPWAGAKMTGVLSRDRVCRWTGGL